MKKDNELFQRDEMPRNNYSNELEDSEVEKSYAYYPNTEIDRLTKINEELANELGEILKWTKVKKGIAQWNSSEEKVNELKELINRLSNEKTKI